MAQEKYEKLGKFIDKAATERSKEKRLDIKVMKASDLEEVSFVPSGIELFDSVIGGFPRGRFTVIFGGDKVGKTTFELISSGNIINNNMTSMIMEPENRAERKWWAKHVDLTKLYISQATGLGPCLDSLIKIVESGYVDVVFIDSLASLAVKELRKKGTEGDHMALMARRLPQFFQMATESVAETGTAVVFLHQKRDVLDMYSGELEKYSGGNALKHHASLVLNFRRASTGKDPDKGERFKAPGGGPKLGFMTNVKCIKGTVGTITEGQAVQLDFYHRKGIDSTQSTVLYAIRNNVVAKGSSPGSYIFTDDAGTYDQKGLNNLIHDVASSAGLKNRILAKCRKYAWEDPSEVCDVDPDVEFETEQAHTTKAAVDATDNTDKKDEDGKETTQEEKNDTTVKKSPTVQKDVGGTAKE